MTKYRVKQQFTGEGGATYSKGAVFDNEDSRIPEDEITGYLDAGWITEDDAAVEGDDDSASGNKPIPTTPGYTDPKSNPDEGGGAPA